MILHNFGDSHRNAIIKTAKEIGIESTDDLGETYTIARVGAQKLGLFNIADPKYNVHEGDWVCFSFGEIDCRTHLCKPENFKKHVELIDVMVSRYFDAIKMNVDQFKNIKTLVNNVVPAISVKDNPDMLVNYGPQTKTPCPIIGTDEERKIVADYMYLKYKEHCKNYNFIFIDVYEKYLDDKGFLIRKLSDTTHIWDIIYLKEFFLKNILT